MPSEATSGEQRRVDEALAAPLLRYLLEHTSDGVGVVRADVDPPLVVAASATHERLVGRPLVGRAFASAAPPEVQQYLRQSLQRAVQEGPQQIAGQWREGEATISMASSMSVVDLGEEVEGTYVVLRSMHGDGTVGVGSDTAVLESLLAGATAERRRIAQALHDDTVQVLGALTMELELLRRRVTPNHAERLATLRDELQAANVRIRNVVADLDPAVSAALGVGAALAARLEALAGTAQVDLAIEDDLQQPLPLAVAEAFYWIGSEAALNAIQHGAAARVEIVLRPCHDGIAMVVHDNGRGFDPRRPAEPGHYGLMSMRARAQRLGGSVAISSNAGDGTNVSAFIPMQPDQPPEPMPATTVDDVASAIRRFDADSQLVWSTIPTGVVLCDRDGVVARANPAAATWLDTGADQLTGRHLIDLVAPADVLRFGDAVHAVSAGAAATTALACRFRLADGSLRALHCRLQRVEEPPGPPWAWMATLDSVS